MTRCLAESLDPEHVPPKQMCQSRCYRALFLRECSLTANNDFSSEECGPAAPDLYNRNPVNWRFAFFRVITPAELRPNQARTPLPLGRKIRLRRFLYPGLVTFLVQKCIRLKV